MPYMEKRRAAALRRGGEALPRVEAKAGPPTHREREETPPMTTLLHESQLQQQTEEASAR